MRLKAGDAMLLAIGVNWGDAAAKRSQADYIPPEHRYVDLINPDNPQRDFIWQSTKAWGTVKFLPAGQACSLAFAGAAFLGRGGNQAGVFHRGPGGSCATRCPTTAPPRW